MPNLKTAEHNELMEIVQSFALDPFGRVRFAHPWGEPGPLEHETGPDENQAEFLTTLGKDVRKRKLRRPHRSDAGPHGRDIRSRDREERDGRVD